MKKAFFIAAAIMLGIMSIHAQIADPVTWTFSTENVNGDEAELVFRADIEPPWHLYSAFLPAGGPIATKPWFNESDQYELVGELIEVTKAKIKFDEGFQMDVGTISHRAELRQKVKLSASGSATITGEIEFQVCDDATCLPPKTVDFSFSLGGGDAVATTESAPADAVAEDHPMDENIEKPAGNAAISGVPTMEDEKSLWRFFWLAFGLGLLALLTPCVFPMIPMTVSFFMQGSESKGRGIFRGLVFGISIVAIYTLLGVIVSVSNVGPNAANALSTHWIPNLIFFALFMVFAFSFFGMFELVLPSSWSNKADSQVDKGGLGGVFFLAVTTVLVSFSCTGPIVGALLVEAAGGLALKPILGMF